MLFVYYEYDMTQSGSCHLSEFDCNGIFFFFLFRNSKIVSLVASHNFLAKNSNMPLITNRMLTNVFRGSKNIAAKSLPRHRALRFLSSNPSLVSVSDKKDVLSYDVVPKDDFGRYKEYSVIHTNRSLNLMSDPFQKVMRDLNTLLKATYNAEKVAIIPGKSPRKL